MPRINANGMYMAAAKAADAKAPEKKAGQKAADKAVAAASDMLATGAANVRIRDGVIQIGVPVTVGAMGIERFPFLSVYVRDKFLAATPVPEDISTAWKKLSDVTVEGNSLKLTM